MQLILVSHGPTLYTLFDQYFHVFIHMAMKQPRMLLRESDSVLISWEETFQNSELNSKTWYILQIHNEFKEWRTVYWLVGTSFACFST